MTQQLIDYLNARKTADGWYEGRLSDSAVSTAAALAALKLFDAEQYANEIARAEEWIASHADFDGLYGDSPESPANITATFLAYAAMSCGGKNPVMTRAEQFLTSRFGGLSFAAVKRGFLAEYGSDLTFSVPILALAAAVGVFGKDGTDAWRGMPVFPFEAVLLPEKLFQYLNLPVVSYAIPALICVGLAQLHFAKPGFTSKLRSAVQPKALRVLSEKQPEDGGFLEAAPLTAFCVICLCAAGLHDHAAAKKAVDFLVRTQRKNGAWPIDRDLRQWTTSLAVSALADTFSESEKLAFRAGFKQTQTKTIHPFTRSLPGGWGWTTWSGSVPDADDTAAALIALASLGEPAMESVQNGIEWLLRLQNKDGGMPTFCRGWGKLPFDRSCPDLSAHAYRAFSLYEDALPPETRRLVLRAKQRILDYLRTIQRPDGSFVPLWFGDQTARSKEAPVYGSAVVLEHLCGLNEPFLLRTKDFLLSIQHRDGAWGGVESDCGLVSVTARCVSALRPFPDASGAVQKAEAFLRPYADAPETIPPEPIGLYFAHLWYSEELYGAVFLLNALRRRAS